MPEESDAQEVYGEPRGTCPQCGSGDVTHLVIGLPDGQDAGAGDPDWVEWIGCMHPGHDRACAVCGLLWTARS